MKKYFLLIAAAATVFAVSCRKAREVEQVTTETPQEEIDDTTPQPVRFGSSLNIQVETKAAIDKFAGTEDLYVWGFERVPATNEAAEKYLVNATTGKAFINNVKATAAATADYHPETYAINVYNPDGQNVNEFFYYTEGKVYDFVGYYLGDAYVGAAAAVLYATVDEYNADHDPDITADEFAALSEEQKVKTPAHDAVVPEVTHDAGVVSKVVIPVTIDGTNDIMLAKTDHDFDLEKRANKDKYVSDARMYSSYSARRTVIPNLRFDHQLSRFVIKTKKGGLVPVNDITIEKIEIESKAAGELYLYGTPSGHLNFEPGDNAADVWLPLKDGSGAIAADHPGDGVYEQLGESIMTFPGESVYHAKLYISQTNVTSIDPLEFDIDVSALEAANSGVAVPGHQYTVNLIVYGAEKVEVTVSISKWVDMGNVDIDPDEDDVDPRAENTIAPAQTALTIAQGAESVAFAIPTNGGDITATCTQENIALVLVSAATAAVNYTAEEAVAYNANLPGALAATADMTAEQVTAYNALMDPDKAEHDELTAVEAAAYNAKLDGAVSTETVKTPAAPATYKVTVGAGVPLTGENAPYELIVKSAGTNTVKPGTATITVRVQN